MPDPSAPLVLINPLKPALLHGVAQKLPVLVRIQAPDADPAQQKPRPPYHLALVIDRSGSMSGEPLREAVRCARYIVDRLQPTDLAALVVFDDRVRTLAPLAPVGERKALHAALAQVEAGGSTNLHGGWEAGMQQLLPQAKAAALARVILLSDGNANVGAITAAEPIAALCAAAAGQGVTTSTYGLGLNFNEDLMVAMARQGGGNPYYGATAADLHEPFTEEFDLIANLWARHLRLSLSAPDGVNIRLLNDYPVEERDGFRFIRLPDLPYGAEAWALLELEIAAGLTLESGNQLLQVGVTAAMPDGAPIAFTDTILSMKAVTAPAWEVLLPDPLVQARWAEVAAGRLLLIARHAAQRGDWQAIDALLADARARFADQPWVLAVLEELAELAKTKDTAHFRKEAAYSSHRMTQRLAAAVEPVACLDAEAAAPSYTRRKRSQGRAQFTLPAEPPPRPLDDGKGP